MKKNIVLILQVFVLCLPLLAGLSTVSLVGLSAFLVYVRVRGTAADYVKGIVAAAAFSAAALYFEPAGALCFVFSVLSVSCIMGGGIRKKADFEYVIITPAVALLAVVTATVLYYAHRESTTAFELLFGDTMSIVSQSLAQTPGMAEYAGAFESRLRLMLPSVFIIYAHFTVYVIFGISRTILEKHGFFIENIPHFCKLRLSRIFTTVFLIILLFSLFGGISDISVNIITVVITLYSVCGLSVCDFYLKRRRIPAFIRIVIYVAAFIGLSLTGFLSGVALLVLCAVGIFDSYKPLRRTE